MRVYWDLDGVLRPRPDKTRRAIERALRDHGHNVNIDPDKFRSEWSMLSSYAKKHSKDVYALYISRLIGKDNVQGIVRDAKTYREAIKDPKPFDYTRTALSIVFNHGIDNILITHSSQAQTWAEKYNLASLIRKVIDDVDVKHPYFDRHFIYIGDSPEDITEYQLALKDGKKGMLYIVGNSLECKKAIYVANALEAAIGVIKGLKKVL